MLMTSSPSVYYHPVAAQSASRGFFAIKAFVMNIGTVKWFNAQKGFGFIQTEGGGPDVFVHISAVERAGWTDLKEGQKIKFELTDDRRSGKKSADKLQAA